jgi:hypothetical protein
VRVLPVSNLTLTKPNQMKTPIHIDNIRETEKYTQHPYIVEVAAWSDSGETGRWGTATESEAREILEAEIAATIKWAADEIDDPETTTIPEIAKILVRPEPDEDGGYDDLNSWGVL